MPPKPYLGAFLFCERVLLEKDGAASIIRVIDLIGVENIGVEQLVSANRSAGTTIVAAGGRALSMFIAFKNGPEFEGTCELQIVGLLPSGKELARNGMMLNFQRGKGTNVVLDLQLVFPESGTYWFELYLDGQLLTKTPLTVSQAPTLSAAMDALERQGRSPSAKDNAGRGE